MDLIHGRKKRIELNKRKECTVIPSRGGKDARGSLNVKNLSQHECVTLMKKEPTSQKLSTCKTSIPLFSNGAIFFFL